MEERAGERRRVCFGLPLSSVLSPLLRRGERKKKSDFGDKDVLSLHTSSDRAVQCMSDNVSVLLSPHFAQQNFRYGVSLPERYI